MRQRALEEIYCLAKRDPRVVFIGSDLGVGTLKNFQSEMPERFFMEGISEQNIIGMAAGLAMDGFIPYVNTIATFLTRRCYEQIAVDLCLNNLSVRLIANGAGLVYAPLGPTHIAIEDIAIMRVLPSMTVVAPSDAEEMGQVISQTLDFPGPIYVRLGKGGDPVITQGKFSFGKASIIRPGKELMFISTGVMTHHCLKTADILGNQGIDAGVMHMPTIKPIDVHALMETASSYKLIVTVEEHFLSGGMGSAVLETLGEYGVQTKLIRLGLPDAFTLNYGSQELLLQKFNLSPPDIATRVVEALGR